jgi:uncharacterized Zn-finger protein
MNKLTNIIANQTEFGCNYCGKNYKTRNYLNKHKVLCETLSRAKKKTTTPEFTDIDPLPSQTQMYKIILDLSLKCNRLEEKVNDMQIWMDKKKKKINIIDWLKNYKHLPSQTFLHFQDKIEIIVEEVELILHQSYLFVFQNIMNRLFPLIKEDSFIYPIYHHIDKPNTLFIYNDIYYENNTNHYNNRKWVEANKEQILGFFKNIHFIFGKAFIQWKKMNENKIKESDQLSDIYNKANIKIMNIQWKDDLIYNKCKSSLINAIKIPSYSITNKE